MEIIKLKNGQTLECLKVGNRWAYMTEEQMDAQKSVLKQIKPDFPQYKTADGYDVVAVLDFEGFVIPIQSFCNLLWQAIRQFHVQIGRESQPDNKKIVKGFIGRTYYLHNLLIHDVNPLPKAMNFSRNLCIGEELGILANILDMKSITYQGLLRKARLTEKKEVDQNGGQWISIKNESITKGFLANIIDHGAQYLLNDASTTGRGSDRITKLISDAIPGLLLAGHLSGLNRKENVERAVKYLAPWDFDFNGLDKIADQFYI